jgi:hypothetical protein
MKKARSTTASAASGASAGSLPAGEGHARIAPAPSSERRFCSPMNAVDRRAERPAQGLPHAASNSRRIDRAGLHVVVASLHPPLVPPKPELARQRLAHALLGDLCILAQRLQRKVVKDALDHALLARIGAKAGKRLGVEGACRRLGEEAVDEHRQLGSVGVRDLIEERRRIGMGRGPVLGDVTAEELVNGAHDQSTPRRSHSARTALLKRVLIWSTFTSVSPNSSATTLEA